MRMWTHALGAGALFTLLGGGTALADTPVASISDSFPEVGEIVDVEMICVPDDDSEPLVPTFEMLAPGGGATVDPEPGSVFGDAGSVFASWVFDAPGLYQLVVSCESSAVYDIEVGSDDGTGTTDASSETTVLDGGASTTATGAVVTLPATGSPDGFGIGAVAAVAAVAIGGVCIAAARRRA